MVVRWLAVLALVLSACAPPLMTGTVIQRTYTPAHTDSYIDMVYTGQSCTGGYSNVPRTCTNNYIYVPRTRDVPDRWTIKIEGCDDEGCREEDLNVTRAEYESYKVGDAWERQETPAP